MATPTPDQQLSTRAEERELSSAWAKLRLSVVKTLDSLWNSAQLRSIVVVLVLVWAGKHGLDVNLAEGKIAIRQATTNAVASTAQAASNCMEVVAVGEQLIKNVTALLEKQEAAREVQWAERRKGITLSNDLARLERKVDTLLLLAEPKTPPEK